MVFMAAVRSGHYLLAVVGVLNAVVATYYYLRVVVSMWMSEPVQEENPMPVSPSLSLVLVVSVVGVLYLGLAPAPVLDLAKSVAAWLI